MEFARGDRSISPQPTQQNIMLNWCEVAVPTNKWLVSLLEDDPKHDLTTSGTKSKDQLDGATYQTVH